MIRLTKREKYLLILTSILRMLNAAVLILSTTSVAKVMECVEIGASDQLLKNILFVILILVLEKITDLGMTAANLCYVSAGDLNIKRNLLKNILWRPLRLFRKKDDAYYINLLTTDVGMYRDSCLESYPWICYFVVYFIFSIIMLGRLSPLLAASTLILSVIPFVADKLIAGVVEKYKNRYSKASEGSMNALKEMVEGYEAIRTGNGRAAFLERSYNKLANTRYAAAKMLFVNALSREALYTSSSILRLVTLIIGAVLVLKGQMRAAMLYAAMNYAAAVSNSFSNFAYYKMAIRSTKQVAQRLKEECEQPCEEVTEERSKIVPKLEYESVSFSFENRKLYEDFSCKFEAGKCYAIIGESGSGKSTLTKLFLKYYDDYTGTIRLNGKDIREISEEDIYEQVGIIDQSPWIFNASLYENITMCTGIPKEDTKEYQQLLEALNLTELSKRVGDKPLGDFGDHISGGERQRINLARALKNQVKLMIFDEPTTGLDPENIKIVNDFIFNRKDVTRIVISHDWSEEYWQKFDGVIKIKTEN